LGELEPAQEDGRDRRVPAPEAARPKCAIVVQANYTDNPFFPARLEKERQHDLEHYPDQYAHTWLGDYVKIFEGAYYAKQLTEARDEWPGNAG
jgi:phage terminase large subunit